jgi:hypothetical protein
VYRRVFWHSATLEGVEITTVLAGALFSHSHFIWLVFSSQLGFNLC